MSSLLLPTGCGFGTAAIAAGVGGGGGGSSANTGSVVSGLQATRAVSSPAPVFFKLTDQEGDAAAVVLEFRQSSTEAWRPITLAAGSAPLDRVPSDPAPYRVDWDFTTDLGGNGYHQGIELLLTVKGGNSREVLGGVTMGNDLPVVIAAGPTVQQDEYSGNVDFTITIADSAADPVRCKVEFNADAAGGFPADGWRLVRPAGAATSPDFAIVGFATTTAGAQTSFRWESANDLPGRDTVVQLRFTSADEYATGEPSPPVLLHVDNNALPQAVVDGEAFLAGRKERGNVPIAFRLIDQESDPARVLVQWRSAATSFPTLPTSAAELIDLLENPARAADRSALQIATESPPEFTGRVGTLVGLAANQLRLPELATTAAGLLAADLPGRTLELLRQTAVPLPVEWSGNPVNGPIGAVASDDGRKVLVLDSGAAGWRVQEIDLQTGVVLQTLATGAGAPKAIASDVGRTSLFVGSSVGIHYVDLTRTSPDGMLPSPFVVSAGPRGLCAIAPRVVLATGDDVLLRVTFPEATPGSGTAVPLLDGLGEPWGVVADPLREGAVYVAECSNDRVSVWNMDERQPRALAARVAPADQSVLGNQAFPRPRALALEPNGRQMLVVATYGGFGSLRSLALDSTLDLDGAADGRADPFVREVVRLAGEGEAGLAAGADRLLVVCPRTQPRLAIAGGVSQRVALVGAKILPTDPLPYDPTTQVVTLATALAPVPAVGTAWRIRTPVVGTTSPTGQPHTFVWDTREVPSPVGVQVRVVPIDNDVGNEGATGQSKSVGARFDPGPVAPAPAGRGLVVADLDGDGDLDLASGRMPQGGSAQLHVYLQASGGGFPATPSVSLDTGLDPVRCIAADLDADGDLDLVTVNYGASLLSFFEQTSPGNFVVPSGSVSVRTEMDTVAVIAADLDGDGRLDLVTANQGAGSLKVFYQTSDWHWNRATPDLGVAGPSDVVAADLDGDGDLDLIASLLGGGLQVFEQTSARAFQPRPLVATGGAVLALTAADLDADGDQDLAAAVYGTVELVVFWQTTPGDFTAVQDRMRTMGLPYALTAADVDVDGDLDLVSANYHIGTQVTSTLSVFQQTARHRFPTTGSTVEVGGDPFAVAVADLNGDGWPDLVSADFGAGGMSLRYHAGPRDLQRVTVNLPTATVPSAVAAGDLDGDGDLDVAVASRAFDGSVVLTQVAPGVFAPSADLLASGLESSSVASADLDRDGDLDLVFARRANNSLKILFQESPGRFANASTSRSLAPGSPEATAAVDLDGDGDLDLVTACQSVAGVGSNAIAVFHQSSAGVFEEQPGLVQSLTAPPEAVIAADVDRNGLPDLVVTHGGNHRLVVFLQTSLGVFSAAPTTISTGSLPVAVVAADLDGDGDLDLATANAGGTLTLVFQSAPGTFAASDVVTLPTGPGPVALVAADLDGDGRVDLASLGSSTLSRHFQLAPRVFHRAADTAPSAPGGTCLAAGDLDGDGDQDLVVGNPNGVVDLFFGGR